MSTAIRVTVWGENVHEQENPAVRALYPHGMHQAIADGLAEAADISTRCATLQEPEHGLTAEALAETDVLIWWGHKAHGDVADEVVLRVAQRVWQGMGLIVLHSGHFSKIFKRLMGTSCSLVWRVAAERERLWVCQPGHPIVQGLGRSFELPKSEMYGEPFAIPPPEEQIFLSWFEGGEAFRSGCTWRRGAGKIFYFSPATRSTRSTTIQTSSSCSRMPSAGPARQLHRGSTRAYGRSRSSSFPAALLRMNKDIPRSLLRKG
jgi:trehalose utilization protein